jgi:hypothetical protein
VYAIAACTVPQAAQSGLCPPDFLSPARFGTELLPAPEKPCGRVNALVLWTRERHGWSQKPVFSISLIAV